MLPAIELDGRVVTESDVVLADLEGAFGPLARVALDVKSFWHRPVYFISDYPYKIYRGASG